MNINDDLQEKGWIRRTILDEPRLTEVVELYESLGFEVLVKPVDPATFGAECSKCIKEQCDRFSTVYVRKQ
ncbi:MAG: hypothetical protein ACW98K_09245 [Candidatus Kariarchaeaceae archaeon]